MRRRLKGKSSLVTAGFRVWQHKPRACLTMKAAFPNLKRARSGASGSGLAIQREIQLTDLERNVFRVLIDTKKFAQCATTIRVVGGWVRDKVLGLQSDDIDIALDDMSGAEFAELVLGYLKQRGSGVKTSKLAVIERNPVSSTMLSTAVPTAAMHQR